MSNFNTYRTEEESPSSDEKMDTGSDTFHSQDTLNSDSDDPEIRHPQVLRLTAHNNQDSNSTQSSDSDDLENGLRNMEDRTEPSITRTTGYTPVTSDPAEPAIILQNPQVLRLSEPTRMSESHNDSLIIKMSNLNIDSPKTIIKNRTDSPETINHDAETKPRNLGISPPRFSSTLTLTTSHPLMGLGSPDYPDLIPKKVNKLEEEKDHSFSSIEDERVDNTSFYTPHRNTSKNNLYFTENFVTAESILSEDLPPDVARVKVERRKIIPKLEVKVTPQRNCTLDGRMESDMKKTCQSTPKFEPDLSQEEYHSGIVEWSESPSQLRSMPNFELPIEMSSSIGLHNDLDSPDVISSSTQEEKSAYQALLDPYTGSVALKHTPRSPKIPVSPVVTRRKIQLPVEEDRCSLDSLSDATLESEDEPLDFDNVSRCDPRTCDPCDQMCSDDDDTKRSKSTNTVSYSDTIPEYSAAEELSNERAWLSVRNGERRICDMKVIEPYKRVVSHGGYSGGLALVVFSACHLPDNSRQDYTYVMDNLFLYVIWTLERLVTEEYILVYLHGSAGRRRLPTFHWLHECYKLIDRRLRKSLKHLYLVHPTFWLKSFVILTKPFISSKFFKKLSYVKSLEELMEKVPVEPNAIPEIVKQFDANRKR